MLIYELYMDYKKLDKEIPYINIGGCGIFAEHLYTCLVKLGLEPKLCILTNNAICMNDRIRDRDVYNMSYIRHIVVMVDKKVLDSTGVYSSLENYIKTCNKYEGSQYTTLLDIDRLKEWNADREMWNGLFDRRYIGVIEKRFNKIYKKLNLVESN